MITRLEALLDSIAKSRGASEPEKTAYQLRNPLLIVSFARPGRHEVDELGRRIFPSWVNGYKACLFDLKLKVAAKSRAGLKDGDTLTNLLGVYGVPEAGIRSVVLFLRRALNDQTVSKDTPLSFFRDEEVA